MKVALLSYGFPEYCIQQANGLARECEVLLMLPRGESADFEPLLDPAVKFVPFDKPRLRQPFMQAALTVALVRRIRQFKADVVHFQQGHLWFNFALPLLRRYPLVATIHDPRHHSGDRDSQRTPQWILDFGFRRAGHVIVHGQSLKREVVELFGHGADQVHVIPHVAIGSVAPPGPSRDDGKTILFFGRIWEYKGLEYLIKAEPLVRRAIPGVKIIVAGQGEDFHRYRGLMEKPEQFLVHNRFISTGECAELFGRASVVVLPYTEATQSGVIPLAYSFAKPVIASRVGALADAVEDGATGLLVPPRDIEALAESIVALLEDPERGRTMGLAGRRKLDEEWSPRAVARQAIEVYRNAIRDSRSRAKAGEGRHKAAVDVKSIETATL